MFKSLFSKSSVAAPEAFIQLVSEQLETLLDICLQPGWFSQKGNVILLKTPFVIGQWLSENDSVRQYLRENELTLEVQCEVNSTKGLNPKRIKNVIAVSSGKGGVGKSTIAVNLALALKELGAKVGVLDADIYGPSVPVLLGTQYDNPVSEDDKHMQPIDAQGLQTISIGNLVSADDAAVWRGPMASKALQQLFNETLWQELDYLIVDMPPGTGDIQLTISQQLPVAGAVVVTTPQALAVADAVKGVAMFKKVNVPVLGVIENMSYLSCTNCDHKQYIFGKGGGRSVADKFNLPLIAQIPLDKRLGGENAAAPFELSTSNEVQWEYLQLAIKTSYNLAQLPVADQQIPVVSV